MRIVNLFLLSHMIACQNVKKHSLVNLWAFLLFYFYHFFALKFSLQTGKISEA